MSHFLENTSGAVILGKPYAAVMVRVKGRRLSVEVDPGEATVRMSRPDTKWVKLPDCYKVTTRDETDIPPSGHFYISADTIDPYHLVADFPKNQEFICG